MSMHTVFFSFSLCKCVQVCVSRGKPLRLMVGHVFCAVTVDKNSTVDRGWRGARLVRGVVSYSDGVFAHESRIAHDV